MEYTELTATATINKPIEAVWSVVRVPGDIKLFHPLIKDSFMQGSQQNGIGAKRYCRLKPMGVMEEVISSWQETESIETDVVGGKMIPPYTFMKGRLDLISVDSNQTQVRFTFCYKLKFGRFGRLVDRFIIRPQFKSAPEKYVTGLKIYMESR